MNEVITLPRIDSMQTDFLSFTENYIKQIKEGKDFFERGFQFINDLHGQGEAFYRAIGMMLDEMKEDWKPEEHENERFENAVARETNLSKASIRRYLKIQKALPYVPEEYREEFDEMGVKEKERVAELVVKGWEMGAEDWRDLVEAPTHQEVDRIARKIKGVEPRSNYTYFSIDGDGYVYFQKNGERRQITRLPVESEDPIVQMGIDLIVGRSHIETKLEY